MAYVARTTSLLVEIAYLGGLGLIRAKLFF